MTVIGQIPAKLTSVRPYWRWRWTGLWAAWTLALLGWVVVTILPNRYEAMTRIFVETENMLKPLLQNIAIQVDVQKQLEVLQRTLLNRNNIIHVAHAADLDLDVQTDIEKEKLYDNLVSRIGIKAEGRNLFTVAFADTDPRQAKKVVETLLNIFVETNLGLNRSGMETARNFIESQIADYERKLKLAEGRLADYKSKHTDILVATGADFASRLDRTKEERATVQARYDDAVMARDQLKSSLETTPAFIDVDMSPQIMVNTGAGGMGNAQIAQAEAQLAQAEARYTSRHPDVIAARRALAQARSAAAAQEGRSTKAGSAPGGRNHVSNPVYEQIKLRLIQAESEVAQSAHRLETVTAEYKRLRELAEIAPKVEAELADLNRDYGVIKIKFEELLTRRESAHISEAVEASDDKLHFRVIEAPRVQARPSFPNRPVFLTAVLVIALAAGGGLTVLLQLIDGTISSAAELSEEFNVRVLAQIPTVEHASAIYLKRRGKIRFILAVLALIIAFVCFVLLNQFVYVAGLISDQNLPMLLQRIRGYAG